MGNLVRSAGAMSVQVVFLLADGERVALGDDALALVYDDLWLRAKDTLGAVSTAGLIDYARRACRVGSAVGEISLSERQSGVFREALGRVHEP
jgi:hypothetical protein